MAEGVLEELDADAASSPITGNQQRGAFQKDQLRRTEGKTGRAEQKAERTDKKAGKGTAKAPR